MYDILIKNGTVIDGTGSVARKFDVGLENGKVTTLDQNIPEAKGRVLVDATDKYVTPGFIDIQNHSDSYFTLFDQPEQNSMLAQGITSIVVGNCGASLAPLPTQESIKAIQKWHDLAGININWNTYAEFLGVLRKKRLGVNVGSLVGHATIRRGILGDEIRETSKDETKILSKLLSNSLDQGALGFSLGLIYAHEVNSTADELATLASDLKNQNKYLSVHLRSEASHIVEALDEALHLAATAEVPLKISHLKVRGQKNWHLFEHVLNKLEIAYHQGLKVSFDVYPYDTSWSVLYTYLPKWAYEGGRAQILRRLASDRERRKILDHLKAQEQDFQSIVIATAENNPGFVGKSIAQIAQNQAVSPEEALVNVLSACKAAVIAFDHNLSQEHVELLCSSPLSMIATDGAGYSHESFNLVHPRCFGTMPRFLKMVREKREISWEAAIKKITFDPAQLLGVNRGVLSRGAPADVVVFDPQSITDRADYEHPYKLPAGIDTVILNGNIAFKEGINLGSFGEIIAR